MSKTKTAEAVLNVATVRAVQMYRAGADQEAVYWMLLHAGLTAELVLS
jgi:hypothetical protein